MGLFDGVKSLLALEPFHTLNWNMTAPAPDIATQMANIRRDQAAPRPWRPATVNEALGVPAVFRAVSLIANTMGVLSLEAFRQGSKLSDDQTPRLVVRPNPFTTPRAFWRDSAYYLAAYGEVWWWTAKRDADGSALSLWPINPIEVTVEVTDNPLRPLITWRGVVMKNEDMTQITYLPDISGYRGTGPLQACGAAVSVSVEAQEWAANFFAQGGMPSVHIHSDLEMGDVEVEDLKTQWVSTPNNMPKVTTGESMTVTPFAINPQAAQLTEARSFQNAEVARMFGIPGTMLDAAVSGQSVTYQNVSDEWDSFVRQCLWPNYLEPIEQAISDLLTRSIVARFNLEGLLRADIKTRYDVYSVGITAGVITTDEARRAEGLEPGGIENRPVPFAPPQAIPSRLPVNALSNGPLRCSSCGYARFIVEDVSRFKCVRCKTLNERPETERVEAQATQPVLNITNEHHLHFPEGFVRSETTVLPSTVTIEQGAVQVDSPVTVHPSDVNISEGAIRLDVQPSNVTVEPAQVTVEPAQVHVDAPITVEPAQLSIAEGAIHVDSPITVEAAQPPLTRNLATRKIVERDKNNRIIAITEEAV